MRNRNAVVMIVVSVVFGLAAVFVAAQWLNQQVNLATRKVAVAARDIQPGSPVTPDMVRVVDWPSGSLPDGASATALELEGRVVKTNVLRGEPLLESKLAAKGTKGGLSSVIADGKRAVTVRVNEVIGVAGFALPGNRVDVMVNTKDDADKPISKIVLEKILVLAVAQEAARDETKPKVVSAVTLELTPEQAEKLDLARSIGALSLVLRNQLDGDNARTAGARKNDLLQLASVKPQGATAAKVVRKQTVGRAVPPAPDKHKIEVIKGMSKSTVEF